MNASSPSKNISCSVVSAVYSSISSSSPRPNSASSTRLARASSKGSSVSAISSIMAHDAAESVAPTNYYTKVIVSERRDRRRENVRQRRTTVRERNWTCLILGIGREKLAIKMCGQNNAPWGVWVFRRDHVGEVFGAIWCHVHESILFYVPIELAERRDEVISDKGVVFGVSCTLTNGYARRPRPK